MPLMHLAKTFPNKHYTMHNAVSQPTVQTIQSSFLDKKIHLVSFLKANQQQDLFAGFIIIRKLTEYQNIRSAVGQHDLDF